MKIAILGYGAQGRAARDYWYSPENTITVCDQNEQLMLPDDVFLKLGPDYLKSLDEFDLIVRSPGIHPFDIMSANSPEILQKVTSVTNEFLQVCPTQNIIGVTGTKGKGTTSTLIARMLKAAGKHVFLGGNIGTPPLDLLDGHIQPDDWVVLELANFQLIDIRYSPHLAACLMIAPEHLNWHATMEEYLDAKQQLFRWQQPSDIAVYFADNEYSRQVASIGEGQKLPYFTAPGAYVEDDRVVIDGQSICRVDEIKLLGKHNWQNVCAAVTVVWQVTQDVPAIRSVITSFTGLEHRLELVQAINGVSYYDDSFGTTPETARVAIEAFAQPKVIILGGSDKGATYDELAQTVAANNVRTVITIGQTGPAIAAALQAAGVTSVETGGSTMKEIVQLAANKAQPGDVVLLSTGCASFGMFKNYKDRGEQFKSEVLSRAAN